MSWPTATNSQGQTTTVAAPNPLRPQLKTAADLFKPISTIVYHRDGLKILSYGLDETMKSGLALSFPPFLTVTEAAEKEAATGKPQPAIYSFDTEIGQIPVFRHFVKCPKCGDYRSHIQNIIVTPATETTPESQSFEYVCQTCGTKGGVPKNIRWCDATFLNPQGVHDSSAALQGLLHAIEVLGTIPLGSTIILDSGTDIWDWIQEWIDNVGKHTNKGDQLMRTEWHKARLKWKKLLLELFAKRVNVVVTAQCQDVYVDGKPTGETVPRVEKTTRHTFDLVLRHFKVKTKDATGATVLKYYAEIDKCRFKPGYRPKPIENPTYEKLVKLLEKDIGVKVC